MAQDEQANLDDVVDPREILHEIEIAQAFWLGEGKSPPAESFVIAGLCRRLIAAEEIIARDKLEKLAAGATR